MAFKELTFEKQETVDIAEKVGKVTEGTYLGFRIVNFGTDESGKKDDRTIVDMENDGGKFAFWAPTAVKINLPQVLPGSRIRLTYKGKEKNPKTGRTFKAFAFAVDTDTDRQSEEVPF